MCVRACVRSSVDANAHKAHVPNGTRQAERAVFLQPEVFYIKKKKRVPFGHESLLLAATRGPRRARKGAALRLQTDLCLPNGPRQWSGKNTIERV